MLSHAGVIAPVPTTPLPEPTLLVEKSSWLRASRAGIFIWSKPAGTAVLQGEPIGLITDPYGNRKTPVLATKDGYILCHNNAPVVHQGDALFNIAHQYTLITPP
jgi:predicted deacylase